jgi:RND family efflux transporter MFP subunit
MRNSTFLLVIAMGVGNAFADETPLKVDSVVLSLIEQVEVPARERGVLSDLHVKEGQIVKAGSVLAQIDDSQPQLALNRARIELKLARDQAENTAKLRLAKKSLELAEIEKKRAEDAVIRYRKAVSQSERDKLQLEVDRAKLQIEEAEKELSQAGINVEQSQNEVVIAENNIQRRRIVSPIDGIVVQVNHKQGEWVEPGKPVIRVVRIDRLRAEGFLDARHLSSPLAGRAVKLVVDLPGRGETAFRGELRFVSPEVDPIDGTVRLWAEVENNGLFLRPGLRGSLLIDRSKPVATSIGTTE